MNRMEDTKLVKKITDWIGIRTKGRSKTRWSDEAINDLKEGETEKLDSVC